MAERSRFQERVSVSPLEDQLPTKKSRDSAQPWDEQEVGQIKSLMEIDFDASKSRNRPNAGNGNVTVNDHNTNTEPDDPSSYSIAPLMDIQMLQGGVHSPMVRPAGSVLPYVLTVPAPMPAQPPACLPFHPFPPAQMGPLLPLPTPTAPSAPSAAAPNSPGANDAPQNDGAIPSLLDLPMVASRRPVPALGNEPRALLPGLPARELEFEQEMGRLCNAVRTRLPLCCVSPVKALENALQRCRLPRGVRKYKQLQKGMPILCKLFVNNLLIGVGVGDSTRAADAKAYDRALRLLRETAFEDILYGMPLRQEMDELSANLSRRQAPSPSSHRRLVVLEDRKPASGSNSFYILMLSAQFSGRSISLTTERVENGIFRVKVMLEEEELATSSGDDELEVKRAASNLALANLKTRCPVIEIISTTEEWKNDIVEALNSNVDEKKFSDVNSLIAANDKRLDEPIFAPTVHLGLSGSASAFSVADLEPLLTELLDSYDRAEAVSPLVIAPLPARPQRLLLFRLARLRGLSTETLRLGGPNVRKELALVPIVRRRLTSTTLLPLLESLPSGRTKQFRIVGEDEAGDSGEAS